TPHEDSVTNLGSGAARWSTIYAATGAINTSDEREKRDIRDISDDEINDARKLKGLVKAFRFKSSFEEKGERSRTHVGWMAQEVRDAFASEGLDATHYAMFCIDEWQ